MSKDASFVKMSRSRNKRRGENEQASAVAPLTEQGATRPKKSRRVDGTSDTGKLVIVSHPLLSQLYPHVQTLRDYVLSKLPASSRLRRKKIASVGLSSEASGKPVTETEQNVARLLDTTVVASLTQSEAPVDDRWEKWNSFSQKGDESYVTLSDGFTGVSFSQTEVCRLSKWT